MQPCVRALTGAPRGTGRHAHICLHTQAHIHICTCTQRERHAYTYTEMYACICSHVYMHTHAQRHGCAGTHTDTCVHVYTHTHIQRKVSTAFFWEPLKHQNWAKNSKQRTEKSWHKRGLGVSPGCDLGDKSQSLRGECSRKSVRHPMGSSPAERGQWPPARGDQGLWPSNQQGPGSPPKPALRVASMWQPVFEDPNPPAPAFKEPESR
jgi:hypothetical protein